MQEGLLLSQPEEKKPENIDRRLRQLFGPEARWEHEWTSVYTFTCRMMERFVHGRVIFAGDAAHVVSPFGARGGNGAGCGAGGSGGADSSGGAGSGEAIGCRPERDGRPSVSRRAARAAGLTSPGRWAARRVRPR